MLLGKRQRPPMKRTTSMTEFNLNINDIVQEAAPPQPSDQSSSKTGAGGPRSHRRNSTDFIETAHFLKACFLCKRRLIPGRDIYMYKGDSAFCSLECRQQQMTQDERKEKYSLASKKETVAITGNRATAISGKGETIAAAV